MPSDDASELIQKLRELIADVEQQRATLGKAMEVAKALAQRIADSAPQPEPHPMAARPTGAKEYYRRFRAGAF